jgi:hypothetical protein
MKNNYDNKDYGLARSKWKQYIEFSKDPNLADKTPQTDLYSRETLLSYLKKYPVVFLKPVNGGKGQGIIKISKSGKNFIMQKGMEEKIHTHKTLFSALSKKKIDQQPYVVQQGINLIRFHQRPIDFRILLLKPDKDWEVMGVMGKWAAKNNVVTNFCRGSRAITLKKALKRSLNIREKDYIHLKDELNLFGLHLANTHFNYARELGLDIGIDSDKKLWIIEGNTIPGINLFRFHEDKTLYPKILSYRKIIKNLRNKKGT